MTGSSEIVAVNPENLLKEVQVLKDGGWRLVQMCGRTVAQEGTPNRVELSYSFDNADYNLKTLRFTVPEGSELPSITQIYLVGFLYENELSEQFNVAIKGIAIDFKGNLYKTAVRHPFAKFTVPVPKK
ncbi:MAG: NADH-quinone oxidoreductase subunit C [Elusimicrobiaceae bacterium]|jgi:ech hydrogenase subunit D